MFPTSTQIGGVLIEPNLVLSPMEGVTDLPFRRLVRGIGGTGLTVTEFVPGSGLSRGDRKFTHMAQVDPDEVPVAIQVYGREPAQLALGAQVAVELGAHIVDINMGCPSKKVCQNSGGSALMREPELVRDIVRAVVAAVQVPVTVKMRSGFDAETRNAPELAWICQEEGASAVTVHWRTRADRYGGARAVDKIAETVQKLSVPVFGNGDVVDLPSAEAMFRDTGCAGLYLGRGVMRNPWLPLQLSQWLKGEPVTVVDAAERERVLLGYLAAMERALEQGWRKGRPEPAAVQRAALGRLKMVANQFCRPLPHGAIFRKQLLHSQDREEAVGAIARYFRCLRALEAGEGEAFAGWLKSPAERAES